MIYNVWGKLDLFCGNNHEEKEAKMEIVQKRAGVFYECPFCKNSFSLKDVEKMFDKIESIISSAEAENEMLDIKNLSFTVGECKYKILENDEKLKVSGVNTKSLIR